MAADAKRPTYHVGQSTWQGSVKWYASTISHDGYHSVLYHRAKDKNNGKEPDLYEWCGQKAERKCLKFQLQTLNELNGSQLDIDYIKRLKINPTYQGDPTSRKDYLNRNW